EVDLALHDLVVPRAPPVRHVLARAVRVEHELAWRVEDTGHHDLPARRLRRVLVATGSDHHPSPFSCLVHVPGARPGTRPVGRSARPRSGGIGRSTRRPPSEESPGAARAATAAPAPSRLVRRAPTPSGASRSPAGSLRTVPPA